MRDVIEEFLDLAVPQIEGLSVGAEARSAFADILAFYLAQVGREALGKGPQFNYDCPESDRRVVARFLDDGRLGVMIVGRTTGLEITSFAVSDKTWQGDLQRIVEMHKCKNPWNMVH